ncbi:transposase [Natrialba aegyptia DSM 13077]|uniref:Transposase n=1 Tax=Natrialba aegyptia DSM 13077 TaxID=1227491 RepID=M0AUC9_9EURY|nr:transposase [Natrialba aegyptia DSM 13077]
MELLFWELKMQYKLDEFDTTKKHIVEILLYAVLLSLVVSRDLLGLVIEHADGGSCCAGTLGSNFRLHAKLILRELREYFATARATDRRRSEDPQATTDPSRTARYYHPTDC